MKVKLAVTKGGKRLHESIYEVDDQRSFGVACGAILTKLQERCTASASIGALRDTINESVIHELDDAQIKLKKL
jgi:hypothetical protein